MYPLQFSENDLEETQILRYLSLILMSNTSFPKAENENGNGERRGTNTPIMAGGPVEQKVNTIQIKREGGKWEGRTITISHRQECERVAPCYRE